MICELQCSSHMMLNKKTLMKIDGTMVWQWINEQKLQKIMWEIKA